MKKGKKICLLIGVAILLFICVVLGINIIQRDKVEVCDEYTEINKITTNNVLCVNDVILYENINNEYISVGKVYKGNYIKLENINIIDKEYVLVDGFDNDYYIKTDNIVDNNEDVIIEQRYKEYIVFNENIVTNNVVDFFDENDNIVYTINFSLNLPIIVKETDKYGVEYNERLLYVKEDDVKEVVVTSNTENNNTDGIRVLNYHFFYEDGNRDGCNEIICASSTQFKSHLDYFKENKILTLKMDEVEMYIDGKIQLPKSVLITIDDGWRTNVAVDLLAEYEMYGSIFLVTSWFNVDNYYKNKYIELHSHGDNIHNPGVCSGGQGGAIKCLEKEKLIQDLTISSEKLYNSTVLAYPFYEYNEYSVKMLKKAGYTMAFAGESTRSDNLIHVGSDKFRLPRFVIVDYTTINDLIEYFGN